MADRMTSVVESHAKQRESIIAAVLQAIFGFWKGFDQWDDQLLVQGLVARTVLEVDRGNEKVRRQARSYANTVFRDLGVSTAKVPPQRNVYPRSGEQTQSAVYMRPAIQYGVARKQGLSDDDARVKALDRLVELTEADLRTAERDELDTMWSLPSDTRGYRRVLHPELPAGKGHKPCGLCVVAADRVYGKKDLMPLHGGDYCTSLPIIGDSDPGKKLNDDDLNRLYDAAGSTSREDLARVRVDVNEHGELGPILTYSDQHWRDVKDVNRDSTHGRKATPYRKPTLDEQRKSWQTIIASSQESIRRLQEARNSGSDTVNLGGIEQRPRDFDDAIKYHRDLIARMQANLRG